MNKTPVKSFQPGIEEDEFYNRHLDVTLPLENESLAEWFNTGKESRNDEDGEVSRYTLEFKQEAVRLVQSGQSMAAAGRSLGVAEQTLFNWVKASRERRLSGADSKPVSAEQMEISRLRAELARGIRVGKDRVRKLMQQHGIKARAKRRFKATTDSRHNLPVAPNLL